MFEHFTFGAQSLNPPHIDEPEPSPTDTSFGTLPPSLAPSASWPSSSTEHIPIDLALDKQSISRDELTRQLAAWTTSSLSPLEIDSDGDEEQTSEQVASMLSMAPRRPRDDIARRRGQRQANVEMQCAGTHTRDLNTLVEQMIASNSQCLVRPPSASLSPPPSPRRSRIQSKIPEAAAPSPTGVAPALTLDLEVDEGYWEGEPDELSLRTASSPSKIRKQSAAIKWGRSADMVRESNKVRCKPRMRKRLSQRKERAAP